MLLCEEGRFEKRVAPEEVATWSFRKSVSFAFLVFKGDEGALSGLICRG